MTRYLEEQQNSDRAGSVTIARDLRNRILSGALPAGERLPSIADLARGHGTTPVTARRALRDLEEEGLVRVEHGVGTFVADWSQRLDFFHLPSFAAEVQAGGRESSTALCKREIDAVYAPAAAALGLTSEARIPCLGRLRMADGTPVAYQDTYLLPELKDVAQDYTDDRSLYRMVLEASGRAALSADEEIRLRPLPAEAATWLRRTEGEPAWQSVRITYDAGGRPLLFDEGYFPNDRLSLRVRRRGSQVSVDYQVQLPEG